MPPEDQEFLLMELLAKYMVPLDNANEKNDVEEYWEQWCRLAEDWMVSHCALSLGDDTMFSVPLHYRR